jgi:hypothetical protein
MTFVFWAEKRRGILAPQWERPPVVPCMLSMNPDCMTSCADILTPPLREKLYPNRCPMKRYTKGTP